MTSFATVDELSIYLGHGPVAAAGLDEATLEQWALLIRLVSADVELAAGIPIAGGSGTHFLPGTYSRDLELPRVPLTIVSVAVNGTALGAGDYFHNERGLLRRGASFDGNDLSTDSGTNWGGPESTVRISYTWTATIPDYVLAVVLRACARVIANTGGVTQESLGSYSVTYANATADGSHVTKAERGMLRRALNRTSGSFPVRGLG